MKRTPLKRKTPLHTTQHPLLISRGRKPRQERSHNRLHGRIRRDRLDYLFSIYIRHRDGWSCQRCGRHYGRKDRGLHNSHFIGRANMATRFDPNNCMALCYGCHQIYETHKATVYRDFMLKRLGQAMFDALIARSQQIVKFDAKEAIVRIQTLLDEAGVEPDLPRQRRKPVSGLDTSPSAAVAFGT